MYPSTYSPVKRGKSSEPEARRVFQRIISGVDYCHRSVQFEPLVSPVGMGLVVVRLSESHIYTPESTVQIPYRQFPEPVRVVRNIKELNSFSLAGCRATHCQNYTNLMFTLYVVSVIMVQSPLPVGTGMPKGKVTILTKAHPTMNIY